MLAARLHPGESRLRLTDVPRPEPSGDEVLVRVAGAGVCRSDIHVLDGMFAELMRLPVTMGHEIAGRVESTGSAVRDLEPGEPVVVMVGWGCGHCWLCVSGHEQLCASGDEAGATVDGGFAEYVLVPHRRHVVRLGELDPVEATPLGCAGITAYAAVRRVGSHLEGGGTAAVIGAGGLGQYAVQLLRELTGATVLAIDADATRRSLAVELGADHAVEAGEVRAATQGAVRAVIDFVGSDETLALAAELVGPRGIVALVGLAGGALPFTFSAVPPETAFTTVVAGGIPDLQAVVRLAQAGRVRSRVATYPLEAVEEALRDLREGRIAGRAVLTPALTRRSRAEAAG